MINYNYTCLDKHCFDFRPVSSIENKPTPTPINWTGSQNIGTQYHPDDHRPELGTHDSERSFATYGPKFWNILPSSLNIYELSHECFKQKLGTFLFWQRVLKKYSFKLTYVAGAKILSINISSL